MRRDQIERVELYFRDVPRLGDVGVWLFGSWIPGRPRWDGLLALGVLLDPTRYESREERTVARATFESELTELIDEPLLDVVILNDAPPLTARRILAEGRRLVSPPTELEQALVRDVNIRAADVETFLRRFRRARASSPAR